MINFLLYELLQPALIIPMKSGVNYVNQTGGYDCDQREYEGSLLPVGNRVIEGIKEIVENKQSITNEDADKINKIWIKMEKDFRDSIRIDEVMVTECQEAWLHVKVVLNNYSGKAILTWDNSD